MKRLSLSIMSGLCITGLLGMLTGCGRTEGSLPADNSTQSDAPTPADWGKGFVVGPAKEGESLYVTEYIDLKHGTDQIVTAQNRIDSRVNGEHFYTLWYKSMDQGGSYCLDVHSPGNGEPEQTIELVPQQWEIPDGHIRSFDKTGDGFVFLLEAEDTSDTQEGDERGEILRIVYTDEQGAFLSSTDLTPMLSADLAALLSAEQIESILRGSFSMYRDGEGYLYICAARDTVMLVLDGDGNYVTHYDCPAGNPNMITDTIREPAADMSGRLVFPVVYGKDRIVRLIGREGNTLKELGSVNEIITGKWCGMYGTEMYYVTQGGSNMSLMRWNVSTGLRESVLNLDALGVADDKAVEMVIEGERKLCLRVLYGEEDYELMLSDQQPEYKEAVTVAAIEADNEGLYLERSISMMARKAPLYKYVLENGSESESREAFRTRIMADIIAGNGPDILSVSREDMAALADKGLLMPIDQLVSQETLDAVLPAIIEEGTLDGKLMGIAVEARFHTLVTSTEIWPGESWTLDDVLKLAKEKDGLEEIFSYGMTSMDEESILESLIGYDLGNSRFLDMENRVSRFEQGNFMEVLETVKRFSPAGTSSNSNERPTGWEKVKKGTVLADAFLPSTSDFFYGYAMLGEKCNVVGYPVDKGSGNYIDGTGLLVVNANAADPQAVSTFLEYLLSFEDQSTLAYMSGGGSLSVRADMADRSIKYNENLKCYVWKSGDIQNELAGREDGTTYTTEYNDFLRSCRPWNGNDVIFDLVWDEASAFFAGDKDALSVTRAIDNRVQLYLDEMSE